MTGLHAYPPSSNVGLARPSSRGEQRRHNIHYLLSTVYVTDFHFPTSTETGNAVFTLQMRKRTHGTAREPPRVTCLHSRTEPALLAAELAFLPLPPHFLEIPNAFHSAHPSRLVHMESLKACLGCAKELVGLLPRFIPKARTVPRAGQAHGVSDRPFVSLSSGFPVLRRRLAVWWEASWRRYERPNTGPAVSQ